MADHNWIFVDVEADGITPYSGRMTEFGAVQYQTRKTFHGLLAASVPDPANPSRRLRSAIMLPAAPIMTGFADWIGAFPGRPIFVSDNPAFDFMWIAYYFDQTLGYNPFGHSGRRISDFWAGLQRDWTNTQKWKKYRRTPHDHNPVHDAMGNVEAFETILRSIDDSIDVNDRMQTLNAGLSAALENTVRAIQAPSHAQYADLLEAANAALRTALRHAQPPIDGNT